MLLGTVLYRYGQYNHQFKTLMEQSENTLKAVEDVASSMSSLFKLSIADNVAEKLRKTWNFIATEE